MTRNFPFEWSVTTDNQCGANYAGLIASSEAETRYTSELIESSDIDAVLVVTSGSGQTVKFPYHYDNVKTENHNDVEVVGRKIARDIGLELGNNFTYHLGGELDSKSGTLSDYARSSRIKYVFEVKQKFISKLK